MTPSVIGDWLTQYEEALLGGSNMESFVALGTGHAVLDSTMDSAATSALPVWLEQMATDDPSWATVQE